MKSIALLLVPVFVIVLNCSSSLVKASKPHKLTSDDLSSKAPTCVYLKNAYHKEYLYTTSHADIKSHPNRVRVFTWIKKTDGPASEWKNKWGPKYDNQGLWLVEKKNCENCYAIKSVANKEFSQSLFSVANTDPEFLTSRPRRPVYAYRLLDHAFPDHEGQDIWTIESIPWWLATGERVKHVRIQSKSIGKPTGEFLYAVGDDETFDQDRRNVFTWSSQEDGEAYGEKGEWIVEKATCPSHNTR